jgi:hypothetical protein
MKYDDHFKILHDFHFVLVPALAPNLTCNIFIKCHKPHVTFALHIYGNFNYEKKGNFC